MRDNIRQGEATVYLALGRGIGPHWKVARGSLEIYKIGISRQVDRRVRAVGGYFGGEWSLVDSFTGTYEIEQALHRELRGFRSPRAPRAWREYYRRSPLVRAAWNRAKRRAAE